MTNLLIRGLVQYRPIWSLRIVTENIFWNHLTKIYLRTAFIFYVHPCIVAYLKVLYSISRISQKQMSSTCSRPPKWQRTNTAAAFSGLWGMTEQTSHRSQREQSQVSSFQYPVICFKVPSWVIGVIWQTCFYGPQDCRTPYTVNRESTVPQGCSVNR